MSQKLREYEKWFVGAENLDVGAFVGGEKGGFAVQFTIGGEYACLSKEQICDLISVLSRRLNCLDKWSATGSGSEEAHIRYDGRKFLFKEEKEDAR